jgi:hypothetical protein
MIIVLISIVIFVAIIFISNSYNTSYEKKHGDARMKYHYSDITKELLKYPDARILEKSPKQIKIAANIKEFTLIFIITEFANNVTVREHLSVEFWLSYKNFTVDKFNWSFPLNSNNLSIYTEIDEYVRMKMDKADNPNVLKTPDDIFYYCKNNSLKSLARDNNNMNKLSKSDLTAIFYTCAIIFFKKDYLIHEAFGDNKFLKSLINKMILEIQNYNHSIEQNDLDGDSEKININSQLPIEYECLGFLKTCFFLIRQIKPYDLNGDNSALLALTFNCFITPGTMTIKPHGNFNNIEMCNSMYDFLTKTKDDLSVILL